MPVPLPLYSAREAITFYNPQEERAADKAPLQWPLIRRIFRFESLRVAVKVTT